jgi:hypothetical protein
MFQPRPLGPTMPPPPVTPPLVLAYVVKLLATKVVTQLTCSLHYMHFGRKVAIVFL